MPSLSLPSSLSSLSLPSTHSVSLPCASRTGSTRAAVSTARTSLGQSRPPCAQQCEKTADRRCLVAAAGAASGEVSSPEPIFFDGGTHYGDLLLNCVLGLTGVWLPLTLVAVARSLFLRYTFTDRRIVISSGIQQEERKDIPYEAIVDVKSVPRFIGEWGDLALTLKDKSVLEVKSVPQFRELAKYCQQRATALAGNSTGSTPTPDGTSSQRKGF